MNYEHTQKAPLYLIILIAGAVSALIMGVTLSWASAGIVAGIAVLSALCFSTLMVRDEATHLAVRFGPLSVFRTRIPYDKITAVEGARSTILDGWGDTLDARSRIYVQHVGV